MHRQRAPGPTARRDGRPLPGSLPVSGSRKSGLQPMHCRRRQVRRNGSTGPKEPVEERLQAPREPGFRGQVAGLQVQPGMERDLALDFFRQLGGTAGAGVHDPITGASAGGAASLQTPGLADGAGIGALPDGALNRGGFPGLGLGGDMLTGSAFTLDRKRGTGGVFSVWGRGGRGRTSWDARGHCPSTAMCARRWSGRTTRRDRW